ncbi:MAG: hypothetical protein IKZ29_05220 [Clostridiales bacterium]|nr:hypothetical protein [Clostridiales bacterium]MBR4915002.1 hypothetical protein [Clostridiales bacterium]MBR4947942.1 hypothetical protein [Clostridiales bacterium]
MQINPIILPSWLTSKCVFQQGVELKIEGIAAPSATVTLEIVKDPTDGRKVSKLDTDYGVILSREATTTSKGRFSFTIPPYKASGDAYTFTFKCLTDQTVLTDIRCGDVWVFLGSDFLSIPMKEANATKAPLKRKVMNYLRFFSPSRSGLEEGEEEYPAKDKTHYKNAEWIKVTETDKLAGVSSAAFSFAYRLSDQISYPVGVVDLAYNDSTILNWIAPFAMDRVEALKDVVTDMGLYLDDEAYERLLWIDKRKKKVVELKEEYKKTVETGDIDIGMQDELKALQGEDPDDIKPLDIDFPTADGSSLNETKGHKENISFSSASQLDFNMIPEKKVNPYKLSEEDEKKFIKLKYRMSILYRTKLVPLKNLAVRGFCFSPDKGELQYVRYDLFLMGLLTTLAEVFEPKEVFDDSVMPSILFVTMHPNDVDFDNPYSVLEFNENFTAFTKMLTMPSGIVSMHDMLLPDKTISFILGLRLATIALGTHFSPKMSKSSPEPNDIEIAGNKRIIRFSNLNSGLNSQDATGEITGFAIAGEDRIFYPAHAKSLYGMCVMVWRDDIEEPQSITYGFTPFPHDATLKNGEDLPILPFRFDRDPAYFAPDLSFTHCDNLQFVGKKTPDSEFETLEIYRTFKGKGIISQDNIHKLTGGASLRIRYETDKSLYGFEPCLEYASLFAPIEIYGRSRIQLSIFNPDQKKKKLIVEDFGEAEIKQQLTWQTITLDYSEDGPIRLNSLRIYIEDKDRNGEIYIDAINFI